MATKIRPIVFKIDEPEGFVMNASNASFEMFSNVLYVSWQSPSYPNGYDGNGKQCIIVNNNAEGITVGKPTSSMMYGNSTTGGGPAALPNGVTDLAIGTRTVTLVSNPVASSAFGAYFVIPFDGNEEQARAYVANLTITILDP